MKNKLLMSLNAIIALMFVACSTQSVGNFSIVGQLTGESPKMAYLERYENKKWVTIDSAVVNQGSFGFNGKLLSPEMLFIKTNASNNRIAFFAENSEISVTAHVDSIDAAVVKGSATNDELNAFKELKKPLETKMDSIYEIYRNTEEEQQKGMLAAQLDSIDLLLNDITRKYIVENPASIISAYLLTRELIYYLELDELTGYVQKLDTSLNNSVYVKALNERMSVLQPLQPGKPAPVFTQADSLGINISLESFKGKYVYIDFWASWCGPCRRANPTVVKVYEKYKDKNFTILGVSMDKDRAKWIAAVKKDGLVWQQVSTLNGWDNPVAAVYGVNSIPHGILIAPDGTIVRRSVAAEELEQILSTLIK